MTTPDPIAALRAVFADEPPRYGHSEECAFIRYPGNYMEPPDPCTCYGDFIRAALVALTPPTPEPLDYRISALRYEFPRTYTEPEAMAWVAALDAVAALTPARECARCGKWTNLAPDGTCWPCAVAYRDEIIAESDAAAALSDGGS